MLPWMMMSHNSLLFNKLTGRTRYVKVLRSDRRTGRDASDSPRKPEQSA